MIKTIIGILLMSGVAVGAVVAQNNPPTAAASFTALAIKVTLSDGTLANEKFFVGRLPKIGESVEYVYVGKFDAADGDPDMMRFQLKVREQ